MTTFDERERAFENRFVHDEDVRFRLRARRDRAVANWASAHLGRDGAVAAAYADEIVAAGVAGLGDEALAQRIAADLVEAGHALSVAQVRAEMDRQMSAALQRERPA